MKKLILSILSLTTIFSASSSVMACDNTPAEKEENKLPSLQYKEGKSDTDLVNNFMSDDEFWLINFNKLENDKVVYENEIPLSLENGKLKKKYGDTDTSKNIDVNGLYNEDYNLGVFEGRIITIGSNYGEYPYSTLKDIFVELNSLKWIKEDKGDYYLTTSYILTIKGNEGDNFFTFNTYKLVLGFYNGGKVKKDEKHYIEKVYSNKIYLS
ncbi:hypothetical protein SGLAD_v1c00700 [Spiroplasma gladiatoris]|uniref:Lipoprotein n=1 Tax=Spiroplasma gladiatoris TaxID=2143 RepID=A0A4P7AGQ4_9MOLU|nr:hypothetical protein [Spiroplasma gladiatoris]QBQ07271.1 hypothetical protein SGLAD_v1c00700 [Spiroplasma gladiatoris]